MRVFQNAKRRLLHSLMVLLVDLRKQCTVRIAF